MSIGNWNLEGERSGVGMSFRKVAQRVSYADFTDGGTTDGTLVLDNTIPAGSFVIGTKVKVETAFDGGSNSTAVLDIGDGSDADIFSYTTHNLATAADNLVEVCDPYSTAGSETGIVPIASETSITLTATVDSDWTTLDQGQALIEIFYLSTSPEYANDYPREIQ
jgi:hypothetical protein